MAATQLTAAMPRLSSLSLYLLCYNSLQALGWSVSLYRLISSLLITKSLGHACASTGNLIGLLQTASFLEVLHGTIGIVPSGMLLPLMQWGGRTHFLLAIVRSVEQVQILPSVFITFAAWSISEVHCFHHLVPYWCGSWRNVDYVKALPYIKLENLDANFFNELHFSYHSFVVVLLVLYPLLWLKLYVHMIKQRQTKLKKIRRKKD